MFYIDSTTLGPSALKAAPSAKRKEASHSGDSKDKKKKSALDEIIEACLFINAFLLPIFVVTLVLYVHEIHADHAAFYQLRFNPLCVFQMEEQKKKSVRSDNWIQANIVVKVVTKRLGEKYYKKKAVIRVTEDSCHPHWVIRCLLPWYIVSMCVWYYRKCRVNTQPWWRWSTLETNSNWTRVIWRRSFQLRV